VRLYDDDLAERVQKSVDNTISRSVSYLAAPALAAAMLEHQVLRTIPVGRHVLGGNWGLPKDRLRRYAQGRSSVWF
jgi:hypothetical protein